MTKQSLVSILMPLHNGEEYLRASIDSILQQTYTHFELIILNDGSTDKSEEIVKSYEDKRIRYESNGRNLGIVSTRNRLLSFAQGDYIAIHDCDDIIHPNKLAKQVAFLETHRDYGVCGSWAKKIDKKGKTIGGIHLPTRDEDIKLNLLFQSSFVHSSVLMRRTKQFEINYNTDFPVSMDFDLWERLSTQTKFCNIPKNLVSYRWHTENISNKKKILQEEKRNEIIRRQLIRLGNFSDKEVYDITAIGSLQRKKERTYKEIAKSLGKLALCNQDTKIFNQTQLIAFCWYRWIFYCFYKKSHSKITLLKLPLCNPKIILRLSALLLQKLKGSLSS